MLDKIKTTLIKLILKKFLLGHLVTAYAKITGYKTQILLAAGVIVFILETAGQIPHDTAEQVYPFLFGGASITFLQKLKRYQPLIDEVSQAVKDSKK